MVVEYVEGVTFIDVNELVTVNEVDKPGAMLFAEATTEKVLADKTYRVENVTEPDELKVPEIVPDSLPPGVKDNVTVSVEALEANVVAALFLKYTVTSKLVVLVEGVVDKDTSRTPW